MLDMRVEVEIKDRYGAVSAGRVTGITYADPILYDITKTDGTIEKYVSGEKLREKND